MDKWRVLEGPGNVDRGGHVGQGKDSETVRGWRDEAGKRKER